ncbi:MAG TPA: secondary thiamine-phosphate synthase enzyme YjbQ [Vicinamibacterales bacterium]|nr:secondary thiamine-phosphate synthase enzyme YjbQ [Vicinamibacterales bacterium]
MGAGGEVLVGVAAPGLSAPGLSVRYAVLDVDTVEATEFVDVTGLIEEAIARCGLVEGVAAVQTHHTTTGLLVNECEPGLLEDLARMFERVARADGLYRHDDLDTRTVNVHPGERRNGHAHCRAALLRTTEWLIVRGGALALGRWQRLFLVEFDGGQRRRLSLVLMGRFAG